MPKQVDRKKEHIWVNAKVRPDSYEILTKAAKANRRSLADFTGILLESVSSFIDKRGGSVDPLLISIELLRSPSDEELLAQRRPLQEPLHRQDVEEFVEYVNAQTTEDRNMADTIRFLKDRGYVSRGEDGRFVSTEKAHHLPLRNVPSVKEVARATSEEER